MKLEFNTDDFARFITDKASRAALDSLGSVLSEAASSGSKFLYEQAQLTSKYTKMRNDGKLSPEEFKSLIEDLNAALQAELLRMNLSARQAGQRLLLSFADILGGALTVLITIA